MTVKEPSVFRDWYLAIVAYKIYRRTWRFPKFIMDLFVPFLVRGHPIKVYLEAVKMK